MKNELQALGERAVKCKGWRWMPGMVDERGHVCVDVDDDGVITFCRPDGIGYGTRVPLRPDLSDPATLGCGLALVRAAWGDPEVSVENWRGEGSAPVLWVCQAGLRGPALTMAFGSEAEALVAALEAAP